MIFIAGNIPMVSEIAPLLIVVRLEQFDYAGAAAIGLDHARGLVPRHLLRSISCRRGPRSGNERASHASCAGSPREARSKSRASSGSTLIAIALAFIALFLVLPLRRGVRRGFAKRALPPISTAINEPDALAAIRLTLLVAAIAVPLNLVFGVTAAWAIAKFDFRGKSC